MEHSALEKPCFLPIEVKKGGTITGGLASAAQLGKLGQYVERLLHEITDELSSGNINADPCAAARRRAAATGASTPRRAASRKGATGGA